MRIRKRQLIPLSMIHPSDPMVQPLLSPSMLIPHEDSSSAMVPLQSTTHHDHHHTHLQDDAAGGETPHQYHTGKGLIMLGSGGIVSEVIPLSPSHLDGKWCFEGEKAMPPKKRRGRGGECSMMMYTRESNNNNNNNTNKKIKTRMKTKMNKKCTTLDDNEGHRNEEEEEERKEEVVMSMEVKRSKERETGSVVMEGSRCSRVNGRGWRCCQQTLVGYSLCEHHLGKGRLRSITSVRTPSIPSSTTAPTNDIINDASSSSSPDNKKTKHDSSTDAIHSDDIGDKKPAVITKKRMKLGMVKARSISSLLGQTDNLVTLHDNSNNK